MKWLSSVQFKYRSLTNIYKYSKMMSWAEQCLQSQPDSRVALHTRTDTGFHINSSSVTPCKARMSALPWGNLSTWSHPTDLRFHSLSKQGRNMLHRSRKDSLVLTSPCPICLFHLDLLQFSLHGKGFLHTLHTNHTRRFCLDSMSTMTRTCRYNVHIMHLCYKA